MEWGAQQFVTTPDRKASPEFLLFLTSVAAQLNGLASLPVYADNAAAVTGGLAVGTYYSTATGEVRVVV